MAGMPLGDQINIAVDAPLGRRRKSHRRQSRRRTRYKMVCSGWKASTRPTLDNPSNLPVPAVVADSFYVD
jgi:hypothetical protein